MKTPTIGMIGSTGRIGRVHLGTIIDRLPEYKPKWLCDVRIDEAQAQARELGIPRCTADYHELLADGEIDAVLICSSTPTHVPCIVDAAQARKQIFCEKPVDLDAERIALAIDAVQQNNVKLQVGFMKRFDPEYVRLKTLLDAGAVGVPSLIRFSSRDPSPPPPEYVSVSGGLFRDMTCHDFDLLRYLTGSEVEEVSVFASVRVAEYFRQAGDCDTAVLSFRLCNGAIGCIDNSRKTNYGYDQRVELFGPNGCLMTDHVKNTHIVAMNDAGIIADLPVGWFMDRYREAYVAELRQFFELLATDCQPRATAADSLRAILIADAANRSLEEKRTVKVDYSLCDT
jgi:myo-inositol 2-dehydrogenase / D-chiro-inositol 1-dehydrogenase